MSQHWRGGRGGFRKKKLYPPFWGYQYFSSRFHLDFQSLWDFQKFLTIFPWPPPLENPLFFSIFAYSFPLKFSIVFTLPPESFINIHNRECYGSGKARILIFKILWDILVDLRNQISTFFEKFVELFTKGTLKFFSKLCTRYFW